MAKAKKKSKTKAGKSPGHPMTAFHFKVSFIGDSGTIIGNFSEVSGLSVEITGSDYNELGNIFNPLFLPERRKYDNLVLKKGIVDKSSLMRDWLKESHNNLSLLKPKTILIELFNEQHSPKHQWECFGAIPIKWEIDSFNSMESKLAMETFHFRYSYFDYKAV